MGRSRLTRGQAARFEQALAAEGVVCAPELFGARTVRLRCAPEQPQASWVKRTFGRVGRRVRPVWTIVAGVGVLFSFTPAVGWFHDLVTSPPPPKPPHLSRELNVVVAPFAERGDGQHELGDEVAQGVTLQIRTSLAAAHASGSAGLDYAAVALGSRFAVAAATPAARQAAATRLARQTNADVVVYGAADVRQGFLVIDAYAYISPLRLVRAEELAGEYPIAHVTGGRADLELDVAARQRLRGLVGDRLQGLGAFLAGLQAFRARDLEDGAIVAGRRHRRPR